MRDGQCTETIFTLGELDAIIFHDEFIISIPEDTRKWIALNFTSQDGRATNEKRGVNQFLFEHGSVA